MAKKKVEEKIVYIDGITAKEGYKNMLMLDKLVKDEVTGELVSIGRGCGLPLKSNERISENAFVEIVRYVELSTDKDLLNKLSKISKMKQEQENRKQTIANLKLDAQSRALEDYETALKELEKNYHFRINGINNYYDPLIESAKYDIETLNIFSDSILNKYEEQKNQLIKK